MIIVTDYFQCIDENAKKKAEKGAKTQAQYAFEATNAQQQAMMLPLPQKAMFKATVASLK